MFFFGPVLLPALSLSLSFLSFLVTGVLGPHSNAHGKQVSVSRLRETPFVCGLLASCLPRVNAYPLSKCASVVWSILLFTVCAGPNECLNLEYTCRLICAVSEILAAHAVENAAHT